VGRPRLFDNERILSAAEELFAEQGFGETSLRQLIERAELSPTAFYARFPSREAVVEALLARLVAELYRMAAEVTANASSIDEGIELAVKGLVKTLSAHKVVVRLALTEGAAIPSVRQTLQAALSQQAALVSSRITKLKVKGKLHQVDAEVLGWSLVGAMTMQIQRWAVFEELGTKKLADALSRTARALLLS
jgi:AcrR family transcriptional regulator